MSNDIISIIYYANQIKCFYTTIVYYMESNFIVIHMKLKNGMEIKISINDVIIYC